MEYNNSIVESKTTEQTGLRLKELERQLERGHLFANSALGESFLNLGEIQVFLHGLIDTLLEKGVISEKEIAAAIVKVRRELNERNELNGPRTMVRIDPSDSDRKAPVQVDCQSRMHVCKAVCCKLNFALSIPEVESGKIKWDLGQPYFIRHDSHGSCTHLDRQSGGCRIYADRPGVCRGYSCAGDSRIWKDFEKMELNTEWIETNLSVTEEPRLIGALMHRLERLTEARGANQQQASGDRAKNETEKECGVISPK